ncbi:hypothetical protein [Fodinicola acaciae]|uniref:hypothetical protein n=1 Tax=Fodinicola acaciae TaxID=2681555 RepID=UPI001FEB3B2A|nr:hypothetical protein [Fodinicola acaciae]
MANVANAVGVYLQLARKPLRRKGRYHALGGIHAVDRTDRRTTQVTVCRNDDGCVVSIERRVLDQRNRDADVRPLFFVTRPARSTVPTHHLLLLEATIDNPHEGAMLDKSFQVMKLTELSRRATHRYRGHLEAGLSTRKWLACGLL